MITIYGMLDSGNCYKPRLLLAKLGRPFRHAETNSLNGSTRAPEFLAKNPNGKVPLLELEDGRRLADWRRGSDLAPPAHARGIAVAALG